MGQDLLTCTGCRQYVHCTLRVQIGRQQVGGISLWRLGESGYLVSRCLPHHGSLWLRMAHKPPPSHSPHSKSSGSDTCPGFCCER